MRKNNFTGIILNPGAMNEYLNKVIDFGEYNMRDGQGKRIKVYFFTMVLSRSRCKFVYFSLAPFTSSLTVYAHLKGFGYFGGVPRENRQ
jgi:transposase